MTSTQVSSESGSQHAELPDLNLEVVVIPVADVDRAKGFYGDLGWRLDADVAPNDDVRLVQFTPPGSGCSIQFGTNLTQAAPGSSQGSYLIVSDIESAREQLVARGAKVSEVFHEGALGGRFREGERVVGSSPGRSSYGSFAWFSDPDGNGWLLAGGDDAVAGPHRPNVGLLRVDERFGERVAACGGRPRLITRSG